MTRTNRYLCVFLAIISSPLWLLSLAMVFVVCLFLKPEEQE